MDKPFCYLGLHCVLLHILLVLRGNYLVGVRKCRCMQSTYSSWLKSLDIISAVEVGSGLYSMNAISWDSSAVAFLPFDGNK